MNFQIVDSTLREGMQFNKACLNLKQLMTIAQMLDEFGVEYIETVNPLASKVKFKEVKSLVAMGLKAKIVPHLRCTKKDISIAVETGIKTLNVLLFGTSKELQESSHGRNIEQIIEEGGEVIEWALKQYPDIEIRVTAEDSFRTSMKDLSKVIGLLSDLNVHRIGLPDSSGFTDPLYVYDRIKMVRQEYGIDLECHFHNDASCAVANSFAFVKAGGTHVDTCVMGLGERNGITDLGGFIARMYVSDRSSVDKYNLKTLNKLNQYVAEAVGEKIPFCQSLNPHNAFSHKAGIHTKAILNNPQSYEVINPEDFGLEREVIYYSSVTGYHAVSARAEVLGLKASKEELVAATAEIKEICNDKNMTTEEGDELLKKILNP